MEAEPPLMFSIIMRKLKFTSGKFYHIYNQGVDKRKIFVTELDYFRFIHSLFEFNDSKKILNLKCRINNNKGLIFPTKRDILVEIIAFCLMPNHFHLILRQIKDKGVSLFMQKLGTGYTLYFNIKQKRNGVLFQGPFRSKAIETDTYILHLSRYIHINPVELIQIDWRQKGIRNWDKTKAFLARYRWSSYLDYSGVKNFPSVTNRKFILGYFDNSIKRYKKFVEKRPAQDLAEIRDIILED